MKKVLVTGVGTITATSIVDELKKINDFYVIGADINSRRKIAASKDVDEFVVFPSSIVDEENFIKYCLDFCYKNKVDYYFAVIDEEVVNLANHRKEFEKINTKLCIPNDDLIYLCHFKDKFVNWIDRVFPEISIKHYSSTSEIKECNLPLFVKPIEGRASVGCKKIDSISDLEEYKNLIGKKYILQDYIDGENVTVDIIRNKKYNQIMCAPRIELIRNSNGCGIAVETICNDNLTNICTKLALSLDLNGVINAEFFVSNENIKIIEINPRYSAGTTFSCLSGCNTVLNEIKIVDEEKCFFSNFIVGKHFARRYVTYEL